MKQKFKFEVTPEIDRQLKELAKELPVINRTNDKGKVIMEPRSKHVPWAELSAEDKIKYPHEEFHPQRRGENFQQPMLFKQTWFVPSEINHYVKLYWAYKQSAKKGVSEYVDWVNNITRASNIAAEGIRAQSDVPEALQTPEMPADVAKV